MTPVGRRAPRPVRRRVRDPRLVHLRSAPAADGHSHCVSLNELGNGETSPGPDGHRHQVKLLEVLEAAGHRHVLTPTRCGRQHEGSQCV